MTKKEAYQYMLEGGFVRHCGYTSDEYVFINRDGKFETEDGYVHGGVHDEFWTKCQVWEDGWEKVEKINSAPLFTYEKAFAITETYVKFEPSYSNKDINQPWYRKFENNPRKKKRY